LELGIFVGANEFETRKETVEVPSGVGVVKKPFRESEGLQNAAQSHLIPGVRSIHRRTLIVPDTDPTTLPDPADWRTEVCWPVR